MIEPFNSVPKCYLAQSDIVVLEDMQCKGFVMLDRIKGLDFDHCRAILRLLYTYNYITYSVSETFLSALSLSFAELWGNFTDCHCP